MTNYPEYLSSTDQLWKHLNSFGLTLGEQLELFSLCIDYEQSCQAERIYNAWKAKKEQ